MAIAEVNGVQLFYEEVGGGPPTLVMHGGLGVDHPSIEASTHWRRACSSPTTATGAMDGRVDPTRSS